MCAYPSPTHSSSCHICWTFSSALMWHHSHCETSTCVPKGPSGGPCRVTTFPLPLQASQSSKDTEWTPGQLGLGTGALPDLHPDEKSARRSTDNHTRRENDGDVRWASLNFSELLRNSENKIWDLVRGYVCGDMCVSLPVSVVCVTASDAESDAGVTCWCYVIQRTKWSYHMPTHSHRQYWKRGHNRFSCLSIWQ